MLIAIIAAITLSFLSQGTTAANDTSPHTERFIQANGVRLQYLDWGGSGEPLVMLTGYGSTAHTFDNLARRFTDRFHVVSYTRRGTAPSERTERGCDLATLTADLKAFLDARGFQRAHLVGHSFSGIEMTEFATLHPDRVASLVYIDAALDFADGAKVMQDSNFAPPQPQPGSPYAQVVAWQNSYSPDFSKLKSPALAFYTTQVPLPVPRNATDEVRRQIDEFGRSKWLPLVNRMADKFRRESKGRAIVFDNASHYIFRDREEEVVREMQNFYGSING